MDEVITINFNQLKRDVSDKFIKEFMGVTALYSYASYEIKEDKIIEIDEMIYGYNEQLEIINSFRRLLDSLYPYLETSDTESEVNVCEVSEEK